MLGLAVKTPMSHWGASGVLPSASLTGKAESVWQQGRFKGLASATRMGQQVNQWMGVLSLCSSNKSILKTNNNKTTNNNNKNSHFKSLTVYFPKIQLSRGTAKTHQKMKAVKQRTRDQLTPCWVGVIRRTDRVWPSSKSQSCPYQCKPMCTPQRDAPFPSPPCQLARAQRE